MSFTEFKAILKSVGMGSKKKIVLEINDAELKGKFDILDEMVDTRVAISINAEVVRFKVQINTKTDKPIKSYTVDETGIVSEVKPEGEQLEADLDLPKDKLAIKNVPEVIEREIVDDFILSGLAPIYEDMRWYPVQRWIERINNGETYLKVATESGLSSGKAVELIDEYRSRVAPLAAAWDEWRKSKAEDSSEQDELDDEQEHIGQQSDPGATSGEDEDIEIMDESNMAPNYDGKQVIIAQQKGTNWVEYVFPIVDGEATYPKKYVDGKCVLGMNADEVRKEIGIAPIGGYSPGHIRYLIGEILAFGGELRDIPLDPLGDTDGDNDDPNDLEHDSKGGGVTETNSDSLDLDAYILKNKPSFEDIPYDFPALLERRKGGETWMQIAASIGVTSGQLAAAWSKYKKRIKEERSNGAA
ncbi:hypothetical protein [Paenibacillus periandrae]|uniref:hypothetical protein n=1 Tax=Paenibacillus periandrae TaxID=1761741 RepID=UPI001F09299C|nr:hypothetical protein [Paenibacillus periandrae]